MLYATQNEFSLVITAIDINSRETCILAFLFTLFSSTDTPRAITSPRLQNTCAIAKTCVLIFSMDSRTGEVLMILATRYSSRPLR